MHSITKAELDKQLRYDPTTGCFTWLVSKSGVLKDTAGYIVNNKTSKLPEYRAITINRVAYKLHHLAVLTMTGTLPKSDEEVDHINHNGLDNRWVNLRVVSRQENAKNRKLYTTNKTGLSGVSWSSSKQRFISRINSKPGVRINLGNFDNMFDAACARKSAEIKYGYHENHGKAL